MQLVPSQKVAVVSCLRIASSPSGFRNLLLYGPAGSGKRTVTNALAERTGLELIEIPVSFAPAEILRQRLVGTSVEAQRSNVSGLPPGDLGRNSGIVFYFSGLERLPKEFWHEFHRLLTRRRYLDASGTEWSISGDAWIVGAITTGQVDSQINLGHWVCTAFQSRISIAPATRPEELYEISASIANNVVRGGIVDSSIDSVLSSQPLPQDHLHALKRWIETAARSRLLIDADILKNAILDDLESTIDGLEYRGQRIDKNRANAWLGQFEGQMQPIALHLLREIASHYYIGAAKMYSVLQKLIDTSGIPAGAPVVFCRWQPLGKSPDRICHMLKNQANWKVKHEIDLRAKPDTWPTGINDSWFVIADDFSGTGDTLSRLVGDSTSLLSQLMRYMPGVRVKILVICGFMKGVQRIRSALTSSSGNTSLVVGHLFEDQERCFHPESRILPIRQQRERLEEYCRKIGKETLHLHPQMHLGFHGFGGLVVFADTVPNNTLPIFWQSTPNWQALFPVSGLLSEDTSS